jgi:hypothetical protein
VSLALGFEDYLDQILILQQPVSFDHPCFLQRTQVQIDDARSAAEQSFFGPVTFSQLERRTKWHFEIGPSVPSVERRFLLGAGAWGGMRAFSFHLGQFAYTALWEVSAHLYHLVAFIAL